MNNIIGGMETRHTYCVRQTFCAHCRLITTAQPCDPTEVVLCVCISGWHEEGQQAQKMCHKK
jgi:hypothetical protein